MITREMREVEVKLCDACGAETTSHLEKCAVCKRDLCNKDGGKEHLAYSLEVYWYENGARGHFQVCKDCEQKLRKPVSPFAALVNILLNPEPVKE
ncbi:MAG: hypothetical protein HYT46_00315 [Candidatus Vogelbacteria bacterium]|nr:hypothetical protein [Candidatus Vogelbacteria bacterium]